MRLLQIYSLLFVSAICGSCSDTNNPGTCDDLHRPVYVQLEAEPYAFPAIGSGQGIQLIGDNIFLYGDSDRGTIMELTGDFTWTQWIGEFTVDGVDVFSHPTGLAYREGYPTFIAQRGMLGVIDWNRFYEDRTLDEALERLIIASDLEMRPEYVLLDGQWYVASAGYDAGETENEMILMDPWALQEAESIDEPGVIQYRFPVPSLIQDLSWSNELGVLFLVQNVEIYKGWRLTQLDLTVAVKKGSGLDKAIRKTQCYYMSGLDISRSELEGYVKLPDKRELFLVAPPDFNPDLYVVPYIAPHGPSKLP